MNIAVNPPSKADNIIQIYELALENDLGLKSAEIQTFIGQREFRDAVLGYFPRVYGQIDYNRRDQNILDSDNAVFARGRANYPVLQGVVEFRQPILDYERMARIRRGDAIRERTFAEFADARQQLILKVAEGYFKALLAQKKVALVAAAKKSADEEERLSKAKRKAGELALSEYKNVEAQSFLAKSELIDARNEYRDALEALRELTGALPTGLAGFQHYLPITLPQPSDPEHWVVKALKFNHKLKAQEFRVETARAQREQARGDLLPKLEAVGTYDYTDQEGSRFGGGSKTSDATYGVRLSVPIFNPDGEGYAIFKAGYQVKYEQSQRDQMRRKVERETRNFYRLVSGASRKFEALTRAVDATAQRLKEFKKKRAAGKITSVDVLEAQRDNLRAQRDLADARTEYILNSLRLRAASGSLSEDNLKFLNSFLG